LLYNGALNLPVEEVSLNEAVNSHLKVKIQFTSNILGTWAVKPLIEEIININVSDSSLYIWQNSSVHN
jgi:hypothetical protein